jgi:hypothetical protein
MMVKHQDVATVDRLVEVLGAVGLRAKSMGVGVDKLLGEFSVFEFATIEDRAVFMSVLDFEDLPRGDDWGELDAFHTMDWKCDDGGNKVAIPVADLRAVERQLRSLKGDQPRDLLLERARAMKLLPSG